MRDSNFIIAAVAGVTGIPEKEITGPRRTRRVTCARFIALAALRREFSFWALADLAAAVGRGDHGMAVHGLRRHDELCETDGAFREMSAAAMRNIFPASP